MGIFQLTTGGAIGMLGAGLNAEDIRARLRMSYL